MDPIYQHGDIVVRKNKRDERGTVLSSKPVAGRVFYRVLFPSSQNPLQVQESDLDKVVLEMTVLDRLLNLEFGNKQTFSSLLTYERLRRPLQDTLYSLRASRTEFQPYQFKPLLKFLRSTNQRLLLADEVGLGKTIEAGFILCEMLARHPHTFRRALVVCKASLCIKWQTELRNRFDLRFDIWKADQLRSFLRRYRDDEDLELRAICSLESFRNPEVMNEWEAMPPPLDIMVIDEAHHLKNSETKSHKACRAAAESSDAVLALTATPIQMGSRDLFNLLSLLDEEEFASFQYFEACMLFNRNIVRAEQLIAQDDPKRFKVVAEILRELGKSDGPLLQEAVQEGMMRSSWLEIVQAWAIVSESLRRHPLYPDTLRLLTKEDPSSRQATVAIQRNLAELNFLSRVFSRTRRRDVHLGTERKAEVVKVEMTPPEKGFYRAVLDYVRSRYRAGGKDFALLFGLMMPQRQLASCIPAMVDYYESEVGGVASGAGLDQESTDFDADDWNDNASSGGSAEEALRKLINDWYRAGQPDSKFEALERRLALLQEAQPGEPIVVFSYFKKTLEYLSRKLGALGYSSTVISGAFDPAERERRIQEFREGRYQILLSTEVGSEGLDFQFCHILFNYDLPWNPMVVEQRIGRLDRFGQKAEKILIFNLSAPGTIEDDILQRLYSRIDLFKSYIGDLESILGSEIKILTRDLFDPDLTEEERQNRIDDTAWLLERRKLQFEEWERASPQFIGHDAYYREEVDRVQLLGRYISAQDLAIFTRDFLARFDRRCELNDEGGGVYRLESSEKLRTLLVSQPETPQKHAFLQALDRGGLRVTFDSDVAEKDRSLAYLHVRHMLIRAIVDEFQRNESDLHPVAAVQMSAPDLGMTGSFLYLIARATIRSAREQDALLPVLVDLSTLEALGEDVSEQILARAVAEAGDFQEAADDPELLQAAFDVAERHMVDRFQSRREDVERLNQAFVDARLASVRESYKLKIRKKRQLLERAEEKGQKVSYIRMLQGYIRNLDAEQKRKEDEISQLRKVSAEHTICAAGVITLT